MPNPNEFFISFSTVKNPGKLTAIKVTIEEVIVEDMNAQMNIALCEHPNYAQLCQYMLANMKTEGGTT